MFIYIEYIQFNLLVLNDIMPIIVLKYFFSISWCISYLTSVLWQHFINQQFVIIDNNELDDETFLNSLLKTVIIYICFH